MHTATQANLADLWCGAEKVNIAKGQVLSSRSFISGGYSRIRPKSVKIRRGSGGGARRALELRGWPLPVAPVLVPPPMSRL